MERKDGFYHMVFVTATDFCHALSNLNKDCNYDELEILKEEYEDWKKTAVGLANCLNFDVTKVNQFIQEAEDQFVIK